MRMYSNSMLKHFNSAIKAFGVEYLLEYKLHKYLTTATYDLPKNLNIETVTGTILVVETSKILIGTLNACSTACHFATELKISRGRI